jgi:uncharacterized protein
MTTSFVSTLETNHDVDLSFLKDIDDTDIKTNIKDCILNMISLMDSVTNSDPSHSHGFIHCLTVWKNGRRALLFEKDLSETDRLAIELACILHEVDDRKFFPNKINKDYPNARKILREIILFTHYSDEKQQVLPADDHLNDFIELVIKMISLVSCSENGNNSQNVNKRWMFIPRDCDRLEASGSIGIYRCHRYTVESGKPLFTNETPRITSKEDLYKVATKERFQQYQSNKESVSMIDHFYDKLLHLNEYPSGNEYLHKLGKERHSVVENFVLQFGKKGEIDINEIELGHC